MSTSFHLKVVEVTPDCEVLSFQNHHVHLKWGWIKREKMGLFIFGLDVTTYLTTVSFLNL